MLPGWEELVAHYWPPTNSLAVPPTSRAFPRFPIVSFPPTVNNIARSVRKFPIKSEAVRTALLRSSVCLERRSQVGVHKAQVPLRQAPDLKDS